MTPTTTRSPALDLALDAVGGLLDLALLEAALDGRERAAHRVDLVEVGRRGGLELVGQRLDEPGAGQRVRRLGDAGLVGDDLLGPEGEPGGLHRRQGERLVAGVGVQALGPAEDRGEGLERRPDDVVVDRLGGQRRAGGLDVEAAHHRLGVRRPEPLLHDPGPHPAGGPELGDLLEQLRPGGEEEREPRREVVDGQAAADGRLDVGDPVGQRERQLLGGRGPGLAHVVAGDADRVPPRELARGELEDVRDQAHRGPRRVDPRPARDVLLEDVVLGGPRDAGAGDALLLGRRDVEREQDRAPWR